MQMAKYQTMKLIVLSVENVSKYGTAEMSLVRGLWDIDAAPSEGSPLEMLGYKSWVEPLNPPSFLAWFFLYTCFAIAILQPYDMAETVGSFWS